jgi:hypothetical protein
MLGQLLIAIAVLIPFLVVATAANAAGPRKSKRTIVDPITLALKLGERYWRVKPCGGRITVTSSETQPVDPEGGVAQASLENGSGIAQAWTDDATCTIILNANEWPSWKVDRLNFHWFCDMMTHELGHLPPLNHGDDGQTNPKSIEYPHLEPGTPNFNSVPECR